MGNYVGNSVHLPVLLDVSLLIASKTLPSSSFGPNLSHKINSIGCNASLGPTRLLLWRKISETNFFFHSLSEFK